jgi:hypothetical protein
MEKMPHTSLNLPAVLIMLAAILLVCSSVSYAAEGEVPDITMTVLESEEAAERVVSEIKLPEKASPVAQERAAKGLGTANEARERGNEFGQERAQQARENGKKKSDRPGKPDKPKKDKD